MEEEIKMASSAVISSMQRKQSCESARATRRFLWRSVTSNIADIAERSEAQKRAGK